MTRRRTITARDQYASAFNAALGRLCDAVTAKGAALVDAEGETVDYAGVLPPFEIRVVAAEWIVFLASLRASRIALLSAAEEVFVRAQRKTFVLHVLEDGYALVVQLPRGAFGLSRRAVSQAIRELCTEAGLRAPVALGKMEMWWRAQVRSDETAARRPNALLVDGDWCALQILGRWDATTPDRESGFRARLANGAEVTLVRERFGRWYVDSPIGAAPTESTGAESTGGNPAS